jgi:S-adenosylmethionine decarboxylase
MTLNYKKGLHILLSLHEVEVALLKSEAAWMLEIETLIKHHNLHCVGSVCHSFENLGGYTAVHCLTESHISIHT